VPAVVLHRPLPLPCNWSRRVRSAAVDAISLADLAFTKSLSWAANSLNPRLRLQAESERLRREIRLPSPPGPVAWRKRGPTPFSG
jgi:hypothetical protein